MSQLMAVVQLVTDDHIQLDTALTLSAWSHQVEPEHYKHNTQDTLKNNIILISCELVERTMVTINPMSGINV